MSQRQGLYIDLLKKYQEDEALYFEIRADVNRYIGYFLDDRKNYIEMPFSMLLDLFEEKKKGSYEAFHDFHLFHSQEENASLPFRLCLRRAVLSGHTLEECVSLLILSLFESLYQREKASWLSKKGDYEEVKRTFIDDIESHGVYLNERLRLSFERTKRAHLLHTRFSGQLPKSFRSLSEQRTVRLCRNDRRSVANPSRLPSVVLTISKNPKKILSTSSSYSIPRTWMTCS